MAEPRPWISGETVPNARKHAPATLRNRNAIVAVLRDVLPVSGRVLEIASGSGEHIVHFAEKFPALEWLPSDPDPVCVNSIAAWSGESGLGNIRPPLAIDASAEDWLIGSADAILCINMIHISPWAATEGLMTGAGSLLSPGAPLCLYGPYRREGVATAPSNEAFDQSLKNRNTDWGLRDLDTVMREAEANEFAIEQVIEMPANNLSVIFRKR